MPPDWRTTFLSPRELERLRLGALEYGCRLQAGQMQLFQDYLQLLYRWNRVHNLTSVPPTRALSCHLLDSLSLAPFISGCRLLDAGSGAGLPGVPLAITHRKMRFSLCDSNGKRCRFLHQVRMELGLANVEVLRERIQEHQDARGYCNIVSRGFACLADFVAHTRHLLAPGGVWLAMKGRVKASELRGLAQDVHVEDCLDLRVDGVDAVRTLVMMRAT